MKFFFGLIVVTAVFMGGHLIYRTVGTGGDSRLGDDVPANNVSMVDGIQIIELRAKGGFTPAISTAKAGVPTILRLVTNGTFDCSSSVRIPSLNISRNLPATGTTDIDLGSLAEGTLQGSCSMSMYHFQIQARS